MSIKNFANQGLKSVTIKKKFDLLILSEKNKIDESKELHASLTQKGKIMTSKLDAV